MEQAVDLGYGVSFVKTLKQVLGRLDYGMAFGIGHGRR
jgi:hypothetical protein